jgi:hypothetical protein
MHWPKSGPLSWRLPARTYKTGSCAFKVTICDLEERTGIQRKVFANGFYRTRSHHGGDNPQQSACGTDERLRCPCLREMKSRVDTLDADTRSQFDQVYEAILGLMSPGAKKQ